MVTCEGDGNGERRYCTMIVEEVEAEYFLSSDS